MADEITGGDVLSYTVFGFGGQAQIASGALQSLAQIVSSQTRLIDSAIGSNSFSLRLQSTINRARIADLKGDLDNGLRTLMDEGLISLPGATSTLNKISSAAPAKPPVAGSSASKGQQSQAKSDFLDQIAGQLNVSKNTLMWALGGIALLLIVKK